MTGSSYIEGNMESALERHASEVAAGAELLREWLIERRLLDFFDVLQAVRSHLPRHFSVCRLVCRWFGCLWFGCLWCPLGSRGRATRRLQDDGSVPHI